MTPVGLNPSEVGGGVGKVRVRPSGIPPCDPISVVKQADELGLTVYLSRWQPSADERAAIFAGADVLLHVWGGQPPVALGVIEDESPS